MSSIITIRIDLTSEATKAIIDLAEGDMRKVLNILEAARLLNPKKYTADVIYSATGRPSPSTIAQIMTILLNKDYSDAYQGLLKIKKTENVALADLLQPIAEHIRETKMERKMKLKLFRTIGDIE